MSKNIKRSIIILFIISTFLSMNTVSFASGMCDIHSLEENYETRNVKAISGTIPSNGEKSYIINLPSTSITKQFIINAVSESTSGALFIFLYDPNGNQVSTDWIMGINEIASWPFLFPKSGDWTVRIIATGTNAPVNVFIRWN